MYGSSFNMKLEMLKQINIRSFDLNIIIAAYKLAELGDKDGVDTLKGLGFVYNELTESAIKREATDLQISKAEVSKMFGNDKGKSITFDEELAMLENSVGYQVEVSNWSCSRYIAKIKRASNGKN